MEDKPRTLRAMLAEAKATSELMVDLAYAALYFDDPDMAEEVDELEGQMSDLVHDMRAVCVLAARSSREAEGMSSVLQVVSSIERMANDAVDISRIVSKRMGIPHQLVADLSDAEEVSHRVLVSEGSHMAHRPLSALELTVQAGMSVMAVRRGRQWITDVNGETVLIPDDVLFLRGSPDGITRLRELAAAPVWEPPRAEDQQAVTDLDRAVDVLVEMKNLSETAVGLAYSALVLADRGLAAEVCHLEDRLDEMKENLELWVIRSAGDDLDPRELRGLLRLPEAADEELHPILGIALGETDEVVVRYPIAPDSTADGASLADLRWNIEPGFTVLAIRRGGRYVYRPRGRNTLVAGDEVIASGPDEGRAMLARICGWLLKDDEDGEDQLEPA